MVGLLGAAFGAHHLVDPDLFQHVAVGRQIVAHPGSLGVSNFIDAYPGYPYVEDKWLACVVVAMVDAIAGLNGVMLYQIALCAIVAIAWYRMQRVWHASRAAAVLGVVMALQACALRLEPRPDTISQALLAATILLVATKRPFRQLQWLTAALFVSWINVHGYFVNGLLVLLAAVVAAALGDRTLTEPGMPTPRQRVFQLAVAVLACSVHPQGVRAFWSPILQLSLLRNASVHAGIQELDPSTHLFGGASAPQWAVLVAPLALAIVASARGASARVRQSLAVAAALPWLVWPPPAMAGALPYQLTVALWVVASVEAVRAVARRSMLPPLLFLGFTVLALPAVRNLSLVIPASLILVAPAWTEIEEPIAGRASTRRAACVALVAVAAFACWFRLSDRWNDVVRAPTRTGWGVDAGGAPLAAADFIRRQDLPGPLLNGFDIGGALLYRLHPERRVFIAGNTSMYPASFFADYRANVTGPHADLGRLTDRYGIQTVVWDLASSVGQNVFVQLAANAAWRLVYLDHAAVVFTRGTRGATLDLPERVSELSTHPIFAPVLPRWLGGKPLTYPALNLPVFLQTIGRPDLALRAAEPLWADVPSESLAVLIGLAAKQTHALGARLGWLESALERYPRSQDLQTLLFVGLADEANRLLGQRETSQSRRYLERMTSLQPRACGPYLGLAKIAAIEGDAARARRLRDQALARDVDGSCRAGIRGDAGLSALP